MNPTDIYLSTLIPLFILLHLLIAPYTKVEESFNIQATHDILTYGLPTSNITQYIQSNYDHSSFPGAVPRTFFGALILAGVSKPILYLTGGEYGQFITRGVLGMFNAFALLRFKNGLARAFGKDVGRWYILLQATQFHVVFYASRTLPNMFAFGLTTLAFREFLPGDLSLGVNEQTHRKKLGIFYLVFAGAVFRSEIAILLFTHLAYQLLNRTITLPTIVKSGLISALIVLSITIPIDSYFWLKPIYPELSGFIYNAILGKSSDWGTSPFHHYFTRYLPSLLINPLIPLFLIPFSFFIPALKHQAKDLLIPNLLFIGIYSLQPHKEARFIIYVIPPLTALASLTASYIWTRQSKNVFYRLGALITTASILGSFILSTVMLLISSLNYPGGNALSQLHSLILHSRSSFPSTISIHTDILTCMTGQTHFLTLPSPTIISGHQMNIAYDKTENETALLTPEFWDQFDWAIMEEPEKAIGKWEVVRTVFGYTGIEFLRPGDGSSLKEKLEVLYEINNVTSYSQSKGGDVPPDSEEIRKRVEEADSGVGEGDRDGMEAEKERERRRHLEDLKAKLLMEEMGRFGTFNLVREAVRGVTGGWWVGPRVEGRLRILKKIRDQ